MVEAQITSGDATTKSDETESSSISNPENETRKGRVLLAIVGVVGGCLSAFVVNHYYSDDANAPFPRVGLTVEETNLLRADPNDPVAHAINRQNSWDAYFRNSSFGIAIFAVMCGVAISFVDGMLYRSIGVALLLAIAAAVLGLISGLASGLDAAFFSLQMDDAGNSGGADPALLTLALQGSIFAIVGAAIGGVVAIATRRLAAVLRGAAGGLVAGLLFMPIATIVFPLLQTNRAIPESLFPKMLMFAVAGGMIGFSISRSPRRMQQTESVSTDSSPRTASA